MTIPAPDLEELGAISERWGLGLGQDQLEIHQALVEGALGSYDHVDALYEDSRTEVPFRDSYRPDDSDNELGAWYVKCDIQDKETGPLAGRTFAIKDNAAVAGVPMMNGSRIVEGYVPTVDATVVRRILDAGGRIVGKAACEDLCFSGASHTSALAPIRNPWDTSRAAGGSSGGSGALVAAGEVDMAIAADQGGSIRIPSAFSGICGIKPTFGLVPYTGIYPIEWTIDHSPPGADDDNDGGPGPARRDQLRRQTAQDIADHRAAEGHWSVPEGLHRWAASHVAPKADWRRLLAAELRKGIHRRPGTGEATWARPPRRPDHGPVIRPGTARPAADIAVVVDTSGSMQAEDHSQAFAEIQAILRTAVPGEAITVYSADDRARTAQNITQTRQIALTGGGDTDMGRAVVDAAAARPRPAVIIVITDGGTYWPPNRPPNVTAAVIAVLTRAYYAHLVPRWITAVAADAFDR